MPAIILPAIGARVRQAELIKNPPNDGIDHVPDRIAVGCKTRGSREARYTASIRVTMLRAWIKLHGVSRGTRISLRPSFRKTSAARSKALRSSRRQSGPAWPSSRGR